MSPDRKRKDCLRPSLNVGRPRGALSKQHDDGLQEARRAVADAKAGGYKLSKEIAREFTNTFARLAFEVRPTPQWEIDHKIREANPRADEPRFLMLSRILLQWLTLLMPFESAKFMSIRVESDELNADTEEIGALEQLEHLLNSYAAAQQQEQKLIEAKPEPEQVIDVSEQTDSDQSTNPAPDECSSP
jgi:hypothetical protein